MTDQIASALCALIGDVLGIEDVTADEDFFELGGTSLKGAVLIAEIQRRFGAHLTLGDLYGAPTADELAERLSSDPPYADNDTAADDYANDIAPVFLVHWYPTELAREIRRSRPVVVLSCGLDGDGDKDWPPPVGIEALAAHYVAQLRRERRHGPYHLVGYSLGGIIAWEMARQLAESGAQVGLLCVIDAPPPDVRYHRLPRRVVLRRMAKTPRAAGKKVQHRLWRELLKSPRLTRARWMRVDHGRRLALIDHRLAQYRMRPWHGRLLLIEGMSESSQLSWRYESPPPLAQAYQSLGLAPGGYTLVQLPGDHSTLLKSPLVEHIAAVIERGIAG